MGGTPPALPPGSDSCLNDEFSNVDAMGPYTSPSWSDLPIDVLLSILHRLELPQALAFASVCTTWRFAAVSNGIPCSSTPWLMSWADPIEERKPQGGHTSAATCNFYHLLDVNKAYGVSFPRGCFVACCGASHGWLVLVNEFSNLVLYNPFTTAMIHLPPITDFACVEAVYGSGGNLEHYLFANRVKEIHSLGKWFYQKAVLSCSPSKGGDYVVMTIHRDGDWLSFVKAGQSMWQVASTLPVSGRDRYADCAYHDGRFYSLTFHGMVEQWDLDELNGPTRKIVVAARHPILTRHPVSTPWGDFTREIVVAARHPGRILTSHLVSTPWGDLVHVRSIFAPECPDGVGFQICKVGSDGCEKVMETYLMHHAMFLGLNHSSCLPTKSFPGLQDNCIYFSAPWMTEASDLLYRVRRGWGGVRIYDIKRRTFERCFPLCVGRSITPSEIWITPNL